MILQHMVWIDERVVVRHDDGRLEKVDPTRPDSTSTTRPAVHNGV
jgi:hypothetical protein